MGAGFDMGWAYGGQLADERKKRQQSLSDQERDAHSQLLFDEYQKGSVTPGQVQKGIDDLYAHEPEQTRLGRFGHFMAKAIKGKQQQAPQVSSSTVPGQAGATLPNMDGSPGSFQTPPTPTYQQSNGPAPRVTHKQDFDAIINSAKTPEQLAAAETARQVSQEGASGAAKMQAYTKLMAQASTPEQKRFVEALFGVKDPASTRPQLKEYVSPDGKQRQWFDPSQVPAGWQAQAGSPKAQKPIFKVVRGHEVLIDPETKQITKDFGPTGSARVTRHQVAIADADGQIHMVWETSVSAPDGSSMPVQTEDSAPPDSKQPAAARPPAPRKSSGHTAEAPKGGGAPGVLDFRKATPQGTKAKEAKDTAEAAYLDVAKASQDPTPAGDTGIVLSWLRGRVNRVTASEIASVNNLGGATMKLEGDLVKIESGKMTDQQRQWFLRSAKDNYDNATQIASRYSNPAPKGKGKSLEDRLNEALQ